MNRLKDEFDEEGKKRKNVGGWEQEINLAEQEQIQVL